MGEENNGLVFGTLIAELLGDLGPRLSKREKERERLVKASARGTVGGSVVQKWKEKRRGGAFQGHSGRKEDHTEVEGRDAE